MNREIINLNLQIDEATTQINISETQLENTEERLKIVDAQLTEIQKSIEISPNDMFSHLPGKVFELYTKQLNITKKLQSQVNYLLGEKRSYKKSLAELETTNDELRLKVQNLTEEDINRGILNYTINENKKLLNKIQIQKERHINLGIEFKAEMKKLYGESRENIKLRKKLSAYENKDQKNESVVLVEDFPEEDWETTSEKSVVNNSLNVSSSVLNSTKNDNNKISIGTNTSPPQKNQTPTPSPPAPNPPIKREICKFHAQRRCHFGDRCRNIHLPDRNEPNSNPPWTTVSYNTRPGFIPRLIPQKNDQRYFNPFTPNRFQSLESPECLGVNLGGYWSVPQNPNEPIRPFYSQ